MKNTEFPIQKLEPETIVLDRGNAAHVMWIVGHLPLPVGSIIELYKENGNPTHGQAIVKGVRLLSATSKTGAQLCLDVEVSDGWEANYEDKTS